MAANMPMKYMGAVQIGSGFCGLACNLIRAVTLALFPSHPGSENELLMATYSAILFFGISALCLVSCLILHIKYVKNNEFYIYHLDWS